MAQKINLEEIRLDNFPEKPTRIWNHDEKKIFYDYRLFAFFNAEKIGHLTISVLHSLEDLRERNNFWFNLSKRPHVIRPVVVFQGTEPPYRGQGVSGRLIIMANVLSKAKFQQPLSSDTTFCGNSFYDANGQYYCERSAKRVWEKLEKEGLAKYCPYRNMPRWVMF